MKTLLIIALLASLIGLIVSLVILFKGVISKKSSLLTLR